MKTYFAKLLSIIIAMAFIAVLCVGCSTTSDTNIVLTDSYHGDRWYFGFGSKEIIPEDDSGEPLYIAGYNNGWEITGVLDYCEARAVWLDTGSDGVLLIGIDCIGLDSGIVTQIRSALSDLPNCSAINVYSTHTHAGIDTLGLWGPIGVDGKNDAYMEALISAAVDAAHEAAADRRSGSLYYGSIPTAKMYRDSRDPQVYDETLHHLRFAPDDGSNGIRLYFYGAHAESLRGDNTLLSRDFPGILCDEVKSITGDDAMFFPGAVGGLIMTKPFVEDTGLQALENLHITANKLVACARCISPICEQQISPDMAFSRVEFTIPMDNTAFVLYKYLGILTNQAVTADSATGYGVRTELSVLMLDQIALTLVPGEIFPELVYGGSYGDANAEGVNPPSFTEIAKASGIQQILIVGLSNDEIGYIVPPSDFLLNENLPYIEKTMDYKGENHYEETNSIGPECAPVIAEAFQTALEALN